MLLSYFSQFEFTFAAFQLFCLAFLVYPIDVLCSAFTSLAVFYLFGEFGFWQISIFNFLAFKILLLEFRIYSFWHLEFCVQLLEFRIFHLVFSNYNLTFRTQHLAFSFCNLALSFQNLTPLACSSSHIVSEIFPMRLGLNINCRGCIGFFFYNLWMQSHRI